MLSTKSLPKTFAKTLTAAAVTLTMSTHALAADISVTVTNLTAGMYFTPLFIGAHDDQFSLFELGEMASPQLEALAEMGDGSGLADWVMNTGGVSASNNTPMLPGSMSATIDLTTGDNPYLSVASMLLPTNDAFFALNHWMIPTEAGTYTMTVHAYDSGTEANNEILGGDADNIPKPPFIANAGTGATGVNAMAEGFVHVHRGGLGDDDAMGGASDLMNNLHRWVGPVAKITVVVK